MAKNKSNIKILSYIFLLLLIIVLLLQFTHRKKNERSFRAMVINPDTTELAIIEITSKNKKANKITIKTEDGNWIVEQNKLRYKAEPEIINRIVGNLCNLKTERIAATKSDKWAKYELTDSLATRVCLKDNKNKIISELMIGKFNFKQIPSANPYQRKTQTKANTFVRCPGEETVFSVDGFLKMNFQPTINSYRYKKLFSLNNSEINRITFQYPADSGFCLEKHNTKWMIQGLSADSASCSEYLQNLSNIQSTAFVDNPDINKKALYTIIIEGNNFSPVEIEAFLSKETNNLIIHSSHNEGSFFDGNINALFDKIFISKNKLIK